MSFVEPSRSRSEFPEVQSGLDPWSRAELPAPPAPKGLRWIATVGPGVIVLGHSIGSGEFLLGTFLACVAVLLVGTRIERTLEILNWILLTAILGGFLVLAFLFVGARDVGRRGRRVLRL